MKSLFPALMIAALLTGCASADSTTSAGSSSWNPFSNISWSSLSPFNWFGSPLQVSEQGVGGLTSSTAMNHAAIDKALDGDYTLRQGMRSSKGDVVSFWQALEDDNVKLVINGDSTVSRVEVLDADAVSSDGSKIGDKFSERYSKAFGACESAAPREGAGVVCKAPDSQHISYLYTGEWHGPEGLMPPDDMLKEWTLSRIIWQQ